MTIVDFLRDRADRNSDDIAFRYLDNGDIDGPVSEWTFSELYSQSAGVAEDIISSGLSDSSVVLAFPPGLEFIKGFYGCLLSGARAVPVPLPDPRSKNPLGRILNTAKSCEATTILTTKELAEMVGPFLKDLPFSVKEITEKGSDNFGSPKADMNKIGYLQFTSGSTGHPKGVAISHANVVSNLRVMGQMLRIKSDQPAIVWAPHYHDLCLVSHILGPVFYGFESTIMSPMDFLFKPVRWLKAISHYRVANTACPNFGYEYSVRRIKEEECEGLDLSCWRIAGNGGEPVLPATMDKFVEKFCKFGFKRNAFMPTYGMAESVLFVAGLKPMENPPDIKYLSAESLENHQVKEVNENEKNVRKIVSCGKPGSDHKIIAVNPDTFKECPPDMIGELWAYGPSVPEKYWGLKEISEKTFHGYISDTNEGPFLRTGDLGFVSEGQIYITGRLKDLIIIAGKNHYPSDIEQSVQNSEASVRAGACVAVTETVNGVEELIIIAEVDDRKMPDDKDSEAVNNFWNETSKLVQGAVSKGHALSVKSTVFVKPRSLEKTSSGKPRRSHYKKLYLEGKLDSLFEKKMPQV